MNGVEGRLEAVVDGRALGWAWSPKQPEESVEVEILVDGAPVASGRAEIERQVLVDARIGTGRYGFDLQLPEELGSEPRHTIGATAGSERVPMLAPGFETVVRVPGGPWDGTEFVPEGASPPPEPFVPAEEPPPDPGEAALVGTDGWLFLRDDSHLSAVQLAGAPLLEVERLSELRDALAERHRLLRELRIPYVLATAPLKERIQGDALPRGLALDRRDPIAQLNAELDTVNGGEVLSLAPALQTGRGGAQVFPRTDSRWNDRGAFLAYRRLMHEAGKRVVELDDPRLPEEASFVAEEGFQGDLAEKPAFSFAAGSFEPAEGDPGGEVVEVADLSGTRSLRMPAPEHLEVTPGRAPHLYEIPGETTLPRAVLVGDDFCLGLIPWLAEHFSRFVFLWADELPLEAIELEMPDVLIQVVSEARLIRTR